MQQSLPAGCFYFHLPNTCYIAVSIIIKPFGMKLKLLFLACLLPFALPAQQKNQTRFERLQGLESAPYAECIAYYQQLDKQYNTLSLKAFAITDAGYPLHLVLFSADGRFDPRQWHQQNKVVILVNNGIHPGEPDGIDASMMLARDLASGKVKAPANVVIGFIPIYNIGGALNRGFFSRVNQNGPLTYGFRGNSQYLDLNRDFIKSDSRDAQAFAEIFHFLDPDIFIDNHVSDGADYQHTMTLLTTQHNKLGGKLGAFLHDRFEPALYQSMDAKNWPMCPYVNFEVGNPDAGWEAFYDPPRYSSGYASLFQTMAFVPETHMLKPFKQRVESTYALMQSIIELASIHATTLIECRRADIAAVRTQKNFPLSWIADTTRNDKVLFKGYATGRKPSEVTGFDRLYYDHDKPFEKQVPLFNYFLPQNIVTAPRAYIIPQGWHKLIHLLTLNKVEMRRLTRDTMIQVDAYRIDDYKSPTRPYENHYKHSGVKVSLNQQILQFLKGDYIILLNQRANRYLVEALEPTGDDSFFAWNFFDAVLQQKEGYSDYRWEDVAAQYLKEHPELRQQLEEKKKADAAFAKNPRAQLQYVYQRSPYYEPGHLRYPVYRLR
jgi:hypothetical protein